jgi:hypothetical protein
LKKRSSVSKTFFLDLHYGLPRESFCVCVLNGKSLCVTAEKFRKFLFFDECRSSARPLHLPKLPRCNTRQQHWVEYRVLARSQGILRLYPPMHTAMLHSLSNVLSVGTVNGERQEIRKISPSRSCLLSEREIPPPWWEAVEVEP